MEFVLIILVVAFGFYIYNNISKNKHVVNENQFAQAGVIVDFDTGTMSVRGLKYKVIDVKSMRWASSGGKNSYAYIEVNDFDNPSHKITFVGPDQAEKFIQRVSMAVEKAGGPSLSLI